MIRYPHFTPTTITEQNGMLAYRTPLRCGIITAEGVNKLNRFVVDRILKWDDITNEQNQTLVVSWKTGEDKFTETWVML